MSCAHNHDLENILTHWIPGPIMYNRQWSGVLAQISLVRISIKHHWIWTLGCEIGVQNLCYWMVFNIWQLLLRAIIWHFWVQVENYYNQCKKHLMSGIFLSSYFLLLFILQSSPVGSWEKLWEFMKFMKLCLRYVSCLRNNHC